SCDLHGIIPCKIHVFNLAL
ncbi:hypothetical protein ACN42_g7151, partial [Penicillium freii]